MTSSMSSSSSSLSSSSWTHSDPNEPFEMIRDLTAVNRTLDNYDPSSKIASFYANRSVFITGATGFIGKVIRVREIERSIVRD